MHTESKTKPAVDASLDTNVDESSDQNVENSLIFKIKDISFIAYGTTAIIAGSLIVCTILVMGIKLIN